MYLEKEDVRLSYEVRGSGPPLLLIHGVVVDSWLYEKTSRILSKYYRVIIFDRRGTNKSVAAAGARFDMDAQISDVRDLLDALGIERTYIAGASAGAVVGQYFMQCYPERVGALIMYEPPILSLLTDTDEHQEWIAMMEDLIARKKYNRATMNFVMSIGDTDDRAEKKPEEVELREMQNFQHFFEDEYSVFMHYKPDIEKSRSLSDRIFVAVGEKSVDSPYPKAAKRFAELAGAQLFYYPGYHNLPSDLPREFAICVLGTLMLYADQM